MIVQHGQRMTSSAVLQTKVPFEIVIIAAGGHARLGSKLGDYLVAFALPE
jgi:glucose dehydrogenase